MLKKKSKLSSKALTKDKVSNQKILQAIQGLDKKLNGLDQGLNKRIDDLGLKVDKNTKNIVDILSAINIFAEDTTLRFQKIDQRFEQIDQRFDKMDGRMDNIDSKIITIKSTMVTKDYLDDKLSDFKINIMGTVNKNDNKVNTLVNILGDKKVLTKKESKLIITS